MSSTIYSGTTNRNGPAISDPDHVNRRVKNAEADDKFVELMRGRFFSIRCTNDRLGRKPSRPETHAGDRGSSANYG